MDFLTTLLPPEADFQQDIVSTASAMASRPTTGWPTTDEPVDPTASGSSVASSLSMATAPYLMLRNFGGGNSMMQNAMWGNPQASNAGLDMQAFLPMAGQFSGVSAAESQSQQQAAQAMFLQQQFQAQQRQQQLLSLQRQQGGYNGLDVIEQQLHMLGEEGGANMEGFAPMMFPTAFQVPLLPSQAIQGQQQQKKPQTKSKARKPRKRVKDDGSKPKAAKKRRQSSTAGAGRRRGRARRTCVVCAGQLTGNCPCCRMCYSGVNNDVRKVL